MSENTDPNGKGDLHEGFDLGWEPEDEPTALEANHYNGAMSGGNVWPDASDLPHFKESVLTY